jgi:hypothetical protein
MELQQNIILNILFFKYKKTIKKNYLNIYKKIYIYKNWLGKKKLIFILYIDCLSKLN